MKLIATELEAAYIVEQDLYPDSRGWFTEIFHSGKFSQNGLPENFVQDNCSLSKDAGVIRGLHFQSDPHAQAKLIWVISGSIYDVIVDIRPGSPSFGKWSSFELTAEKPRMLFVPRGFAHGFCTLAQDTKVFYKVDSPYAPQAEGGIRWDDPDLAIPWPARAPIVSDKDKALPLLKEIVHIQG